MTDKLGLSFTVAIRVLSVWPYPAPRLPSSSIVRPISPRMPNSAMPTGVSGPCVPRPSPRRIRSAAPSLLPISLPVIRSYPDVCAALPGRTVSNRIAPANSASALAQRTSPTYGVSHAKPAACNIAYVRAGFLPSTPLSGRQLSSQQLNCRVAGFSVQAADMYADIGPMLVVHTCNHRSSATSNVAACFPWRVTMTSILSWPFRFASAFRPKLGSCLRRKKVTIERSNEVSDRSDIRVSKQGRNVTSTPFSVPQERR